MSLANTSLATNLVPVNVTASTAIAVDGNKGGWSGDRLFWNQCSDQMLQHRLVLKKVGWFYSTRRHERLLITQSKTTLIFCCRCFLDLPIGKKKNKMAFMILKIRILEIIVCEWGSDLLLKQSYCMRKPYNTGPLVSAIDCYQQKPKKSTCTAFRLYL
jgi:hypothetical protein